MNAPLQLKAHLVAILLVVLASAGCAQGVDGDRALTTKIHFPRDAAMHPTAHTEWWYVVGHLTAGARRFGFETTLFKLNKVHLPDSKAAVSVDRVDVALTDVTGHKYVHSVTYAEPPLTRVRMSTKMLNETIGSDQLRASGKQVDLTSSVGSTALHLTLSSLRTPLLEGGTGLVPMGSGGSSHYYSLTDLKVTGHIRYRGKNLMVHGVAWMDHQWGSWSWNRIRGWTWGGVQLADGTQLSLADFHTAGSSLEGSSISYPGGKQTTVRKITIVPTGHWKSPRDHVNYPSGWTVRIPGIRASLTVAPLVRNQEMYDSVIPQTSYWEGDCSVKGSVAGRKVNGQAYMELVGVTGHFF